MSKTHIDPKLTLNIEKALPNGDVGAVIGLYSTLDRSDGVCSDNAESVVDSMIARAEGESGKKVNDIQVFKGLCVLIVNCPADMMKILLSYEEVKSATPEGGFMAI